MRTSIRIGATALLAGLATMALAQNLAIVGARIEPVSGPALEKGTILIRDGKIAAIAADLTVPEGTPSIDAAGMTAYPGFLDGYSTRGLKVPDAPAPATRPASTATAPATMWSQNRTSIRARLSVPDMLDLKDTIQDTFQAGFAAGLQSAPSGLMRGTAGFTTFDQAAPSSLAHAISLSFRGGGGGGGGGYPSTLIGNVALMRQIMYDALHPDLEMTGEKADPDLVQIAKMMRAGRRAIFNVDADLDIYRAMTFSEEFDFKLIIAGGRDAYRRAAELKRKGIGLILGIDLGVEPGVTPTDSGPPKEVLEERRELWRERARNTVALANQGVDFGFCSDGGRLSDYLPNVRRLIGLGLPKAVALRAMTLGTAKALGIEASVGSLEVGKAGHVTLMSGDFADANSVVRKVVVMGKAHDAVKEETK